MRFFYESLILRYIGGQWSPAYLLLLDFRLRVIETNGNDNENHKNDNGLVEKKKNKTMADLCFEEQSNVRSSFTWKTNKQTNSKTGSEMMKIRKLVWT